MPCGPKEVCKGNDGDFCAPILRYADVLLIYAEAANLAEGKPSTLALNALNQVRKRAGLLELPATLTKDEFDKAVLDERNWELAFEHNRWFDLVRRDMLVSTLKSWYPDVNDTRRWLPKPSTELALMKGLKQNAGY
ncbi:MAG: RagB/SusD family nutrient uptake outer membrane protein, partial [Runella zeae]